MIINSVIVKKGAEPTTGEGDYLVRYIDYDGTILKEQWVDSGENATPPADPSHSGLTFQEWNRASTNVTEDRDIGATYATSDGKTKVKIRLTTVSGKAPTLYLNKSDSSTLTINWGDGTSNTYTNSGNFNTGAHTYANYGDYEITMWISSGSGTYTFGNGSDTTIFIGGSTQAYRNTLLDIFIGEDVTSIGNYAFYFCHSLTSVTIPSSVTSIGSYAFNSCYPLTSVTIPSSVESIETYTFAGCYSLTSITIPSSVESIGSYAFNGCNSLTSVTIPSSVTSIGSYAFFPCSSLTSITIPNSVTSIGNNAFQNCFSLTSITIPNSVTSIGNNAFQNCFSILEYIFERTTPPTLGSNAFLSINSICKIYVPDASVDDYKTATNWSTYADYIYSISERV